METWNSTMKRCQSEHQRQLLKQFLSTATTIVRQRSKEYTKEKTPYAEKLIISNEVLDRGRAAHVKFVNTSEKAKKHTDKWMEVRVQHSMKTMMTILCFSRNVVDPHVHQKH